ncbi:Na+/H+ antiporter subunit E [Aquabacterium sp. J223]|uniref:Na+/H+ antiporter subunit E n=1 Tax=Aquabacterium sp. J223 TaxID=2898431 RepID=UPI0021AE16D1|nr:Na+/H+ antiporter subunit E [Aquabacterium sp. J223]UUX94912.1 Na+/H+ antiporter subunit E [Aquabacterium sp. J223]
MSAPLPPERQVAAPAARRRWGAHPVLSVLIAAVWLLLQGSLALPHLLVAALLALGLPWLLSGFLGPGARLRGGRVALRLVAVVLYDIVVANLTVARLVLDPRAQPRPDWVRLPLTLRHPQGVALLASIITMTPGTVSCRIDEARGELLIHALDCDDPEGAAQDMRRRYEAPLMEIFEP